MALYLGYGCLLAIYLGLGPPSIVEIQLWILPLSILYIGGESPLTMGYSI